MKRWFYRAYSNYKEPRSIVNQAIIEARTRAEAIASGKAQFRDYGRHCTAVPKH